MLNLKTLLKLSNFFFLAPGNVFPPTAEAGTSHLLVKWEAPGMPNGIVTGYFLYKDGVKVYTGGGYSFNISGLQVKLYQQSVC